MSWDSVPWFVGGGAQHSPEVARLLPYVATGGVEGIVEPGDLKVVPLDVPGGAVRALPGAALFRNRATGGSQQSYAGRLPSEDVVEIAPTDSSGPRSDMVIARIEDPFMPGEPWQNPPDPVVGPYVFTRVLPNVGAANIASPLAARSYLKARGMTAIPLAGITLPASTGTVTSTMIRDLRNVARPRRERNLFAYALTAADGSQILSSSAADGQAFPGSWSWQVDVPEWATYMQVIVTWNGVRQAPEVGGAWGSYWGRIGSTSDPAGTNIQPVSWDTSDRLTGAFREVWIASDSRPVPAGLRGRTVPIYPRARIQSGSVASRPRLDANSAISFDIEFEERPS